MTGTGRRRFTAAIKAKVAIDLFACPAQAGAVREQKTAAQIASAFECHPSQVAKWKQEAIERRPTRCATRAGERSEDQMIASLDEQIGRLTRELEGCKKRSELAA